MHASHAVFVCTSLLVALALCWCVRAESWNTCCQQSNMWGFVLRVAFFVPPCRRSDFISAHACHAHVRVQKRTWCMPNRCGVSSCVSRTLCHHAGVVSSSLHSAFTFTLGSVLTNARGACPTGVATALCAHHLATLSSTGRSSQKHRQVDRGQLQRMCIRPLTLNISHRRRENSATLTRSL